MFKTKIPEQMKKTFTNWKGWGVEALWNMNSTFIVPQMCLIPFWGKYTTTPSAFTCS